MEFPWVHPSNNNYAFFGDFFLNPDIPPSPSGASCSVLSSTGGPSVVLELDPSFIMDYAVESYTVTVDPATSSCSNDQLISPKDRYSCTGLTVGTNYTFSISAVNCVDQIGATHAINVHPQSKLCHNDRIHTHYLSLSLQFPVSYMMSL